MWVTCELQASKLSKCLWKNALAFFHRHGTFHRLCRFKAPVLRVRSRAWHPVVSEADGSPLARKTEHEREIGRGQRGKARTELGAASGRRVPGLSHPAPRLDSGDSLQRPKQSWVPLAEGECWAFPTCRPGRRRRFLDLKRLGKSAGESWDPDWKMGHG